MKKDDLQKTMEKLDAMSKEFNCEFCLPPFKNSSNPFFVCLTSYKNNSSNIIQTLCKMGLKYKISFEENKQFIEILLK